MPASPSSPPPAAAAMPPAPATITALSDDLLLQIFLRLPDIMCLARAAFACRAFLRAVRSSPAFRRRFRQLRAPPLLALFLPPYMRAIVPADAGKRNSIAADFERLLQDSDSSESDEWRRDPELFYYNEYTEFINQATLRYTAYSLHSRSLKIYSKNFHDGNGAVLEFHTLSHDGEEQRPSQVVCIHRDHAWAWARVAVFSAHTMEWQVVLPEMDTGGLLVGSERYAPRVVRLVNGFVCWLRMAEGGGCILALNTATFQFSRVELPPPMKAQSTMLQLGHTKDGNFCVVCALQCMLSVWLWANDSDGVERLMLHKTISLRLNVIEISKCSEEADVSMRPTAVINGFAYLSLTVDYDISPEWFLSLCLETAEVTLLHKESELICPADPYIMVR